MRRGLLLLAVVGLPLLAGCGGVSGAMTVDDSVEIVRPSPLQVVGTPVEVRWTGELERGERMAVFVDRDAVAPGRSLEEAFEEECEGEERCPDEIFLSARGVYLAEEDGVSIPLLQPRAGVDGASTYDVHRLVLVVLDGDGRRVDERAWQTEFRVQQ